MGVVEELGRLLRCCEGYDGCICQKVLVCCDYLLQAAGASNGLQGKAVTAAVIEMENKPSPKHVGIADLAVLLSSYRRGSLLKYIVSILSPADGACARQHLHIDATYPFDHPEKAHRSRQAFRFP